MSSNELENVSFDKLLKLYTKYFTLNYLNSNTSDKLAVLGLTCYLTNELRKKKADITCYDVLLKIGKDFPQPDKDSFLKSLGVICQDLMYGCTEFSDFGVKVSDMPKTLKKLLQNYTPF